MARILVAAAGTGGHVYPGLALAAVLRDRGHDIRFAGGDRVEARLVPQAGFPLDRLPGRGLPRSVSPGAVLAGADLLRAVMRARGLVRRHRIDVVVGMGGYQSVAPAVAAGMRSIPVVLHEQNGHLSLAHRMSLRWAAALALAVPLRGGLPTRRGLRVERTGNPLRPPIRALASADPDERARRRVRALERFGLSTTGRTTLLVFGGSLGSQPLNNALFAAARRWTGRTDLQLIHLTGPDHLAEAETAWQGTDLPRTVLGYLPDIEEAYSAADVVATRSGGSVAELTALGLPSVLVPGPWATGGHQEANARWLDDAGAATMVLQDQPGFEGAFSDAITALLGDADRRASMASAALALGLPDAADRLADLVEDVLRSAGRS